MTEKMTLNQFIEAEHKRIEKFKQFWLDGMETECDPFPEEMDLSDWVEQLQIFDENS